MDYYYNEAIADQAEAETNPLFFREASPDNATAKALWDFHRLVWDCSRAIDNFDGRPEGLAFHQFGGWKIEDGVVVAFNGQSYWQRCDTPVTAEILEAIAALN